MPYSTCSPPMNLVLSHTSFSSSSQALQAANGDTGKDPGYIVLNNGDTGKDPGARETGFEDIQTLLSACGGDRSTSMA